MNFQSSAAHGRHAVIAALLFLLTRPAARAADLSAAPLPEPLTLEYALSLADAPDPDLLEARADVALAQAQRQEAGAGYRPDVAVQGRAFRVDPAAVAADQGRDDSSIGLVVRQPLFDFGRTHASVAAASAEVQGSEWRLLDARQQRRMDIMERYFEVLLADRAAAHDALALTLADRSYQRAQARHQQGQISRIDLRAQEAQYLAAKQLDQTSAAQCHAARIALADSLGQPGQLPAKLAEPGLPAGERTLQDAAALQALAEAHNPQLLAQRTQVEAARQRVAAARAQRLPTLSGELAAADYSRQTDERDDWRAGVVLEMPLYAGGRTQAAIAARQAELQQEEAELLRVQQTLRHTLQATLDEIAALRVQREQARAQVESRSLALERSRALQPATERDAADTAQAELAEAQLFSVRTDYQWALAWARLDALLGADTAAPAAATLKPAVSQPLTP